MTTSSSSLKTVLNTTVTRSFFASRYLEPEKTRETLRTQNPVKDVNSDTTCPILSPPQTTSGHLHGLVVSVMDDGSLLALATFLLELKVFLKDGCKAVSLQHARLVDHLLLIGWKSIQVKEQRHVVACGKRNVDFRVS